MATIFICSVQSPEVQYKCTQPVHTVHYTVQYSALCRVMKVTIYIIYTDILLFLPLLVCFTAYRTIIFKMNTTYRNPFFFFLFKFAYCF